MLLVWFTLLLFCSVGCVSSERTSNETTLNKLYVLAMIPDPFENPPPSNLRGNSFIPAVRMAIDHINEAAFLSRFNVTLDVVIGDSGCNVVTRASNSFIENIFYAQDSPVIGAVGPFCSAASIRLAELTTANRSEIVNIILGNTPILDDHTTYPYTFGIITSSVAHVNTLIKMIVDNDWKRIAVLYDSKRRYYISTFQAFKMELSKRNLSNVIQYEGGVDEEFYIPLNEVKSMDIRVVFVLVAPKPAKQIGCIAGTDDNFLYPAYQFVFIDKFNTTFEIDENFSFTIFEGGTSKKYECDQSMIQKGINGSLLLSYALDSVNENKTTVSGFTVKTIREEYEERVSNFSEEIENKTNKTVEPYIYAGRYYDGTWALALALNRTLSLYNVDLSSKLDSDFRKKLRESLYPLDFQGYSIKVSFNSETGHVTDNVDIAQVSDFLYSTPIGVFDGKMICTMLEEPANNSTCTRLRDGAYIEDEFETEYVAIHVAIQSFGLMFIIFVFALTVSFHIAILMLRDERVVKASSPKLIHFIFLGCYLQIFAILLDTVHSVSPINGTVVCNLTIVTSLIGYAFIFSTIIVRSWRLYRIFNHAFNSQKYNSDTLLAVMIVVLVLINIVLYIPVLIWGEVDEIENSEIVSLDTLLRVKKIERLCRPQNPGYIFIPVIYMVLLALAAVLLAYLNRKVKLRDFNDTKRTNVLAFSLAILWGLLGSVLFLIVLVSYNLNAVYVLYASLTIISVLVTQCILVGPLMYTIATRKHQRLKQIETGFRKLSIL